MDNRLLNLKNANCDIDAAIERVLNDDEFLLECIEQVLNDDEFALLGDCLNTNQTKQAFEYAHTLKGIIANTGLTPLYDIIIKILEPLRNGHINGLIPLYNQLLDVRENLKMLII